MELVNKSSLPEYTKVRVVAAQIMAVINGNKSETVISTELREELPEKSGFFIRPLYNSGREVSFEDLIKKVELYFGSDKEVYFTAKRYDTGYTEVRVLTVIDQLV